MIRSRTFRSAMLVIVVMPGSTACLLRRAARDYGPELVRAEWMKNSIGWFNCRASWRQHWPRCAPRSTLEDSAKCCWTGSRLEDADAPRLGHLRPGIPYPPYESGGRPSPEGFPQPYPGLRPLPHVEYPDHFVANLDRFLSE
jgi:hypothetical protein